LWFGSPARRDRDESDGDAEKAREHGAVYDIDVAHSGAGSILEAARAIATSLASHAWGSGNQVNFDLASSLLKCPT